MTNDNDSGHDTRLTRREALRGGSAAAVAAGSALLSQHLVSTARAASAGDARIIMGSAPDPDTNGEISFDGTDLKAYSGGAVRNFSNIGSGGSAVEAQEDGSQLTTDTTLIDWQSGLTATNPTGDEISVNVDESEFSLSASNITGVSADSVSGAHHSKTTQAKAGDGLTKSGDTINSRLDTDDDGVVEADVDNSSVQTAQRTVDDLGTTGETTGSQTQSISSATRTQVTLEQAGVEDANAVEFDDANDKLIAQLSGSYLVAGSILWDVDSGWSSGDTIEATVLVGGTAVIRQQGLHNGANAAQAFPIPPKLASVPSPPTDIILQCRQSSGSSKPLHQKSTGTYVTAHHLG